MALSPPHRSTARHSPTEEARWWLARGIFWLLTSVVAVVLAASIFVAGQCWFGGNRCETATGTFQALMNGLNPVLTVMVGVFGSVVGFYFGVRQNERDTAQAPAQSPAPDTAELAPPPPAPDEPPITSPDSPPAG